MTGRYTNIVPAPSTKPQTKRKKVKKEEPAEHCQYENEIPSIDNVISYAILVSAEKQPEQEALLRKLMGL